MVGKTELKGTFQLKKADRLRLRQTQTFGVPPGGRPSLAEASQDFEALWSKGLFRGAGLRGGSLAQAIHGV